MDSKIVFGINMSHDTACAAVIDGEVKVAIEEERLNGVKHCDGRSLYGRIIPYLSIRYCCETLGIKPNDVDYWMVNAVYVSAIDILRYQLLGIDSEKVMNVERPGHHLCHAYSAFYPSPYEEAAILSLDVNGGLHNNNSQKENYSIYHGKGTTIEPLHLDFIDFGEVSVPELYTIYSTILQLSPDPKGDYGKDDPQRSGGKLMGYAAHYFNEEMRKKYIGLGDRLRGKAESKFAVTVPDIIEEKDHHYAIKMSKMIKYLREKGKIFDADRVIPFEKIMGWDLRNHVRWNYRKTDLYDFENVKFAYEGQLILEEYILKMARYAYELTGSKNLCVAGGSMLNVVACSRILKETPIENLFVQPASNDAGNAVGAALYGYYKIVGGKERVYTKKVYNTCLGRHFSIANVEEALYIKTWGLPFNKVRLDNEDEQIEGLIKYLKNDQVVCIYKGRSEFGPRALGSRSFLASPGKKDMLDYMNEIKGREWYRPVAPIVLKEVLHEYFDAPFDDSPYMTINAHCLEKTKELCPAICHIDGSARVQTISEEYYPFLTKLLRRYAEVTGRPPILINTSFNIGKPIVEVPEQAINTFLETNHMVKALLLENYLVELPETDVEMGR
jgi:carbamoyltransferase